MWLLAEELPGPGAGGCRDRWLGLGLWESLQTVRLPEEGEGLGVRAAEGREPPAGGAGEQAAAAQRADPAAVQALQGQLEVGGCGCRLGALGAQGRPTQQQEEGLRVGSARAWTRLWSS